MGKPGRSKKQPPVVLIIDDNSDEAAAAKLLLGNSVSVITRRPEEVKTADLTRADLVLIDLKLDDWKSRDNQDTPSLRPQDGIALAAILRSNLPAPQTKAPTAFALRSGKLSEIGGSLPHLHREHIIARLFELEWAFPKGSYPKFARQVKDLAAAVKALPKKWPALDKSRETLRRLLGVPSRAVWRDSALHDIERCSPPADTLAEASRGMALVRWLLHEILPYPTFLYDERYLAARLHLSPASLRELLDHPGGARIRKALSPFEYRGLLSVFLGTRWWRAGIEHWLWTGTKGRSQDRNEIQKLVRNELSRKLTIVVQRKPVVSVDDSFRPTDTLIDLGDAAAVTPDNWPHFADPAWISAETAGTSLLAASRLTTSDREKLNEARGEHHHG